tara:strand:+ start:27014 stop:27427 length:414 start_codon:yes stop_codon:yes gene_type:complete
MNVIFIVFLATLVSILPTNSVYGESTKVNISGRDCKKLIQHRARSDVNFKPGVDVRGRKVIVADLNSRMKLKFPTKIEFKIGFNPLKGSAASRFGETSATVGKVKYNISKNSFSFNGKPLNEKALDALAAKCKSAAK